jgi:hypothetical protein
LSRPLRFPNPGSDIPRLVNTFGVVARAAEQAGLETFDLDFMTEAVVLQGQASSRGAVGKEALRRSRDSDRSRDPLYNQLKMYSEVYRMLGWMRPSADRRLEFRVSVLGETVAAGAGFNAVERQLLADSLLSIAFPNPNTDNVGVTASRPFRWLMLLALRLDGIVSRHEMILGLLAVNDDRKPDALDEAVDAIMAVRGSKKQTKSALSKVCDEFGVTQNTLENYTRLPVAVLKDPTLGWGDKVRLRMQDKQTHEFLRLTPAGIAVAESLLTRLDIREADLAAAGADLASRAALAEAAHIEMMRRAGLDVSEFQELETRAVADAERLLADLGDPDISNLLYSPFQQASDEVIEATMQRYAS